MTTPYEQFGGAAFFDSLTAAFYRRVAADDVLRPMYPDDDLAEAERRLRMFLEQYWGGPTTYGEERGHPRLRMRHHAFPIDSVARDRWIAAMRAALDEQALPPDLDLELWRYLLGSAYAMQNIMDDTPPGSLDQVER